MKLVQLVRLLRAGEPVKMSKRAGEFVTLREVVDEVGRDAVRFDMLYRKNDAVLDFDLAKVIEQSAREPGVLRPVRPCARRIGVPQRARRNAGSAGCAEGTGAAWLKGAALERLERFRRACAAAPDRALPAAGRGRRGGP